MTERLKLVWFYILTGAFIALNCLLIYNEFYWFTALPVALILVGLALFSLDKLLLLIVLCTPLSFNLEDLDMGFGLYLPTEPLMFGTMLLFLIKVFYDWRFDTRILKHPITIIITLQLIWIFVTSITSEMPEVSLKFLMSRLWFVLTFYFLATQVFKNIKTLSWFHWLYIIPMLAVIGYTVIHHGMYGFEEQPGHWVMQPFFNDHTSYGAIMALFYPTIVAFLFMKRIPLSVKIGIGFVLAFFTLGLILSYTRAAWVSILAAFLVYLAFAFKIHFKYLFGIVILVLGLFLFNQHEIMMKLEKNRQDSSDELAEHVQSIGNVATDASNMERLNRWTCALKMFAERPHTGWGPGTYQFIYAPYQKAKDKTIISTNFGNRGNAHSEFLGPLSESGWPGMLIMIALLITVFYTGTLCYLRLRDREVRILLMCAMLGLVTYFTHGLLNNFLDTDKASVPVWGFIAMIVAIDVYYSRLEEPHAE